MLSISSVAKAAVVALLLVSANRGATIDHTSGASPQNGREVLSAMHDRYEGKWFNTLTFQQTTGVTRADGSYSESTWYESVKAPDRLRIDFGHPSLGNGVLYTADSVYRIREGKLTRAAADGNPFIPFVVGVYAQPVDVTLAQLEPYHIDMSLVHTRSYNGKDTYVVGAKSAADTTSPQFWVEADRLILTRMILGLGPDAAAPPYDVHLDGYRPIGASWLATDITMSVGGKVRQTEKYSDWRVDPELSADLFEPSKWSEAKHWVK